MRKNRLTWGEAHSPRHLQSLRRHDALLQLQHFRVVNRLSSNLLRTSNVRMGNSRLGNHVDPITILHLESAYPFFCSFWTFVTSTFGESHGSGGKCPRYGWIV